MTDLLDKIIDAPIITKWKEKARRGDLYAMHSLAKSALRRYPGSRTICDEETASQLCQTIAAHPRYGEFQSYSGMVFKDVGTLKHESEAARIEWAIRQQIIQDRVYDIDENRPWTRYELEQLKHQLDTLYALVLANEQAQTEMLILKDLPVAV
ncbi:MAG: hypothetical protein KDD09_20895 [Phaeodactylibacter sp.]|nr:hypothetical protein [Phaeodactylibacter sp.]